MIEITTILALGMVSMFSPIMPYDLADNPVLELNGNTISWIPYDETSKFDIIRDGKTIVWDTEDTSYTITKDGCYHIEDESHFRILDSNTICLKNGEFTTINFVQNEPPRIVNVDLDNSQFKMNMDPENKINSIDTLEILIWDSKQHVTHLHSCNNIEAKACYDPNNHRIHISEETLGSLWHELLHAKGLAIPNYSNFSFLFSTK